MVKEKTKEEPTPLLQVAFVLLALAGILFLVGMISYLMEVFG